MRVDAQKFKSDWKGIVFILISALGFSTLGIFGKLIYAEGLNVTTTLTLRFSGAAFILWTWLLLQGDWKLPWRALVSALGLGLFFYSGQAILLFSALNYASAGITALMLYTYPALVSLLNWVITGDRPTPRHTIALCLVLIGCLLIIDVTGSTCSPKGILLGLGSGLWYSFYLVLSSRLIKTVNPLTSTAYITLGAAICFAGIAVFQSSFVMPSTVAAVTISMALVIVSTIVPMFSLLAGIQLLGIFQSSILSTIEPLIAVLFGILFLGETLTIVQLFGGTLIVISVVLVRLRHAPWSLHLRTLKK